jgi:hypothetical protein
MATKPVTISLDPIVIAHLTKVKNRSALISRLLCRHFNLDPDTLEPLNILQPIRHFISTNNPNKENDEHGI